MKNEYLITGLAGAIFLAFATQGVAAGGQGGMGGSGPRHSFEEVDINGDGQITKEEMAEHRAARFSQADTDGDGMLSRDEMLARAEEQQAKRRGKMIDKMISRNDADGDGALTMEEMAAGRGGKHFAKADANEDGAISKEEFEAMGKRHGMKHSKMKNCDN